MMQKSWRDGYNAAWLSFRKTIVPLRLTVLSYKGSPLLPPLSAEFDQQGGSIGRKADNTLVLADSEQYLSGHHARIRYQEGQYWLDDTSTNGSVLVHAGVGLNNTSAVLQDQEIVRMGDYELKVELLTEAFVAPEPVLEVEPLFAGPFATTTDDVGPFSAMPPDVEKPTPDFMPSPPASVFHDSFAPPAVMEDTPQAADDTPAWLRELDHLSQIDSQPSSPTAPLPDRPTLPFAIEPEAIPETSSEVWAADPSPAMTPMPLSPVPVSDTPVVQSAPQIASGNSTDAELLRLFLEGAGIQDVSFIPPEQSASTMTAAGALFRCLIEGVMDVLRARAEMKSEFRVSVTTIRAVENNPLKFNPDVESVLKLMLGPHNPAFMPASAAVSEAVKDIKQHQLAMTAGIQASLAATLQRFAPDTIEKGLGEGLIFQKKARCWELYCEKYPQLKALAMDDFFGDEFVEAYEKQMRLLDRR